MSRFVMVSLLIALLAPAAWAEENKPAPDTVTHELRRKEPWYSSTAQQEGPSGLLRKGTRVAIIQWGDSNTEIWTEDGEVWGMVRTESLRKIRKSKNTAGKGQPKPAASPKKPSQAAPAAPSDS